MARNTGPVCRLCRREGMKLFLKGTRCETPKCAFERRDAPPGSGPYQSHITTKDENVIDASHLKNWLDAMPRGGSCDAANLVQAARDLYISREGFAQWCGERGEPFPEFWGGEQRGQEDRDERGAGKIIWTRKVEG